MFQPSLSLSAKTLTKKPLGSETVSVSYSENNKDTIRDETRKKLDQTHYLTIKYTWNYIKVRFIVGLHYECNDVNLT